MGEGGGNPGLLQLPETQKLTTGSRGTLRQNTKAPETETQTWKLSDWRMGYGHQSEGFPYMGN